VRAALAALLLGGAAAGCVQPQPMFNVVLTFVDDVGKPMAGVPLEIAGKARQTDPDGRVRLTVRGDEGTKLGARVAPPKGWKLTSPFDGVVLRYMIDLAGHRDRTLPIESTVKLEPIVRHYAVLVDAGVAGLPVEVFGQPRTVTNGRGIAAFLYDGVPGDELRVSLNTDGSPFKPKHPSTTFMLSPRPDVYVFKEHFETPPSPKAPAKHKPKITKIQKL
jgi:hypothetical protein